MSASTAIATHLAARIKSNLIDEPSKHLVDQLVEIVHALDDLLAIKLKETRDEHSQDQVRDAG